MNRQHQVAGDHYTRCSIQPWDIIQRNELDFWEGNVIKYLLRWRHKDGLQDLYKARHYLEYLINREENKKPATGFDSNEFLDKVFNTEMEFKDVFDHRPAGKLAEVAAQCALYELRDSESGTEKVRPQAYSWGSSRSTSDIT